MKKIQIRRRRENKTDYGKRIKFLKSEKPRLVVRRTNRYLIAQYVESHEAKDKVVFGETTKKLLQKGWPETAKGSLKSLSACYLLGYLFGKEIAKKKLETPIIDFGMLRVLHKTKLYAFLKGLKESGITVECPEEFFPDEERIKGGQLKNKVDVVTIKSKIDKE